MKKSLLFVALAVLVNAPLWAQNEPKAVRLGIKGGWDATSVQYYEGGDFVKGKDGFHAGLMLRIKAPLGFTVQPELLYGQRGVSTFIGKGEELKQKAHNLDVPINLTWGIDLKIVRPFIVATPYLSYRFNDMATIVPDASGGHIEDISKFNYGMGLGAGCEVFGRIQIMARQNFGLRDLTSSRSKDRVFSLSLGFLF
ncbi:MAG: porin family protein [Bacteroidales bacterium]